MVCRQKTKTEVCTMNEEEKCDNSIAQITVTNDLEKTLFLIRMVLISLNTRIAKLENDEGVAG